MKIVADEGGNVFLLPLRHLAVGHLVVLRQLRKGEREALPLR